MNPVASKLNTVRARLSNLQWAGLIVAVLIVGLGFILGLYQKTPWQQLIFYAAATFALVIWVWNAYLAPGAQHADDAPHEGPSGLAIFRAFIRRHLSLVISLAILLGIFLIASATVPGFFSPNNLSVRVFFNCFFNLLNPFLTIGIIILKWFIRRQHY